MNTLPKELTKELLSTVLDKEVTHIYKIKNNILVYEVNYNDVYNDEINIDTLTRLMKEWCIYQEYCVETDYEGIVKGYGIYVICRVFYNGDKVYDNYTVTNGYQTEFEAVLKATYWVAKEKGFINGN